MRYEKPLVINLSKSAVQGEDTMACMPGGSVLGYCTTGNDPQFCAAGTSGTVYAGLDCYPGAAPMADYACVPGGAASGFECSSGGTPLYVGACTSGPAPVAPGR